MNKLLLPCLIMMIGILGFWVYLESEVKQKQEINRLVNEAHSSLEKIEAEAQSKKFLIKKDQ